MHIKNDSILYWKGCEGVQIVILLKRGACGGAGDPRLITYDMRVHIVLGGKKMTQQDTLLSVALDCVILINI